VRQKFAICLAWPRGHGPDFEGAGSQKIQICEGVVGLGGRRGWPVTPWWHRQRSTPNLTTESKYAELPGIQRFSLTLPLRDFRHNSEIFAENLEIFAKMSMFLPKPEISTETHDFQPNSKSQT
tara:strand:+ start:395 stop:763 length:369 start_codon:yes stop_codon:yes gene_type:complete